MSLLWSDPFLRSPSFLDEDTLTKLHLTHDPDGRRLDSERVLRAIELIMLYASASEVPVSPAFGATAEYIDSHIELSGSQEPLGLAIYKISRQILCKCSGEGNLHMRTMSLFDMVGNYKWDAKMALVLAAFMTSYGEFWLLMQLYPRDPLAVSIAMLKQFPSDLSRLKPHFKALNQLVKTMVDVTECVIKFESLPLSHIELDKEISLTKSYICVAAYWVTRSALTCSSQITDLRAMKPDKYLDRTIIAVWELSSLVSRLSSICCRLRRLVEVCHQQTERKIWQKLLNLFKETPMDNQEVLYTLFALTDDLPLQDCSSEAKLGVSELRDKVVMLLISKPEFLPEENFVFLVQQTYDHPLNKDYKGSYEIVWFPISSTNTWTDAEVKSFNFFSTSLPWYSIRRPWLISSAVVKYVKQAWNYTGEPLMVVFDSQGMVTNTNAIDMVMIWGVSAYPFSIAREEELWKVEKWTLKLMIDEIDPLLAHWVKQGRNLCIYASENQEWIQEVNSKMKEIKSAGVQLEMVYVGKRNLGEHVRNILASISEENPIGFLSLTKIQFFWLRLESMRRSKLRLEKIVDTDPILEKVSALLDFSDKGWAVIAKGLSTDILKLQGDEVVQYLNLLPQRREFLGAVEPSLLPGPCNHTKVIPYAEGLIEETAICEKCKRPMKKFIVFE